jgi:hypothetical protein
LNLVDVADVVADCALACSTTGTDIMAVPASRNIIMPADRLMRPLFPSPIPETSSPDCMETGTKVVSYR